MPQPRHLELVHDRAERKRRIGGERRGQVGPESVGEPRLRLFPPVLLRKFFPDDVQASEAGTGAVRFLRIDEAREVLRDLRISNEGLRRPARLLQRGGLRQRVLEEVLDQGEVSAAGALLHRLDLHPLDRFLTDGSGTPGVAALEHRQAMGRSKLSESAVETTHFAVVEVNVPDRTEDGKTQPLLRRRSVGKSGSGGDHAGDVPLHFLREQKCHARAAGEPGRVDPARVDREAAVRVGPHRLHCGDVRRQRAVALRVVRAHQDPAVVLGRVAEALRRARAVLPRIVEVQKRPLPIPGVGLRQVERIRM